jgi:hypothetical protein
MNYRAFRYNQEEHTPGEISFFLRESGYAISYIDIRSGGGKLSLQVDRLDIRIEHANPFTPKNMGYVYPSAAHIRTDEFVGASLAFNELSDDLKDLHQVYSDLSNKLPGFFEESLKLYKKLQRRYSLGAKASPDMIKGVDEIVDLLPRLSVQRWIAGNWWQTNVLREDFRYNPQVFSPLELINELEGQGYQKVISDERPFHLFIVKFPEIGLYIEFPDADLAEIKKKQENLFPFVYWVPDHNLFGKMYTAHSIETGLGEGDPVEIANLEKAFNEHYEAGKRVFEALQKKHQRSEGDVVTELKDWDKVEEFMEGGGKKGWLSKLLG